MNRRTFLYGGTAVAGSIAGGWLLASPPASAGPVTVDAIGDQVQTLPRGQYPEFAGTGEIQRLYRYAVERGDELQYIPASAAATASATRATATVTSRRSTRTAR